MNDTIKRFSTISTSSKTQEVAEWLRDKKALDLLALDLSAKESLSETIIIATATSIRHAQGLADYVLERCRESSYEFLRMEGYAVGQWILLDLNDIIVHIFQEDNRDSYKLGDLWPNSPVIIDELRERGV